VGSEALGFSGQTGSFDTADAGVSKPVTVSGIQLQNGSGLASNYSVSNPAGLPASITPGLDASPLAPPAASTSTVPLNSAIASAQSSAQPTLAGGNVVTPQLDFLPAFDEASATLEQAAPSAGRSVRADLLSACFRRAFKV
jgi:hypothetical protein